MGIVILSLLALSTTPSPMKKRAAPKRTMTPGRLCIKHGLTSRYCGVSPISPPSFKRVLLSLKGAFKDAYGEVASLRSKVHSAALLPSLSLEYGRFNDTDVSWSTKPGEDLYQDAVAGLRQVVRLKLTWQPRLLLFDPNEIILIREKRKETLLRETYLERGRRLYFKWKRELLLFLRRPGLSKLLRLEELEAALDIMSDGAFSRLLPGT